MTPSKKPTRRISAAAPFSAATVSFFALTLSLCAAPALRAQQALAPAPPAGTASNNEIQLTLEPTQSQVHWTVDSTLHTVHGTLNLKGGVLHFDPQTGKASGEIIVFSTSGESGNSSRDARMHKEILESPKFPEVIFRPTQIEGSIRLAGPSDLKLHGTLTLHGADHPLTAQVHATLSPDHWTATAAFDVPYIAWGLKDPSNFLLRVKPVVNVNLELSGFLQASK
jgi:polyisoprenoid-binding protein YceI